MCVTTTWVPTDDIRTLSSRLQLRIDDDRASAPFTEETGSMIVAVVSATMLEKMLGSTSFV